MAIDITGWCAAAEQPRRAKLPYSRIYMADEPSGFHIKHFRFSTSRRKDERSAPAVWYFVDPQPIHRSLPERRVFGLSRHWDKLGCTSAMWLIADDGGIEQTVGSILHQ